MLWLRDFPVDKQKLGSSIIVHGHTPKSLDYILNQEGSSAINIDGGCVYKYEDGLGKLIALNISEGKLIATRNIDN